MRRFVFRTFHAVPAPPPTRPPDLAASYVKFVESAGARAVPIQFFWDADKIRSVAQGLNGFLFPGGGASLAAASIFFQAAQTIFDVVLQANDNGEHVPLWGTCLGFETIMILGAGGNQSVLTNGFDSYNLPVPLHFEAGVQGSRMFAGASAQVFSILKSENVTMNNHQAGVTPPTFLQNTNLTSFYRMLSTNYDRAGRQFLSTVEGVRYPVYGTQWHPEKNAFEWYDKEDIPHSGDAVLIMQYLANFLVSEARRNTRSLGAQLDDALIYNFSPVYTGKTGGEFVQEYQWPVPSFVAAQSMLEPPMLI